MKFFNKQRRRKQQLLHSSSDFSQTGCDTLMPHDSNARGALTTMPGSADKTLQKSRKREWFKLMSLRPKKTSGNTSSLVPAPAAPSGSTPSTAEDTSKTLWMQAYDALKKDSPKLIEEYEKILLDKGTKLDLSQNDVATDQPLLEQGAESDIAQTDVATNQLVTIPESSTVTNVDDTRERMAKLIELGSSIPDTSSINFRKKTVKIVEFVDKLKANVTIALRTSPEASIAWAAATILLPLWANTYNEKTNFHTAFEYVVPRAGFYVELQAELLDSPNCPFVEPMKSKLKLEFVELYKSFITFQVQSVRRIWSPRFKTIAKDALQWDVWKDLVKSVTDSETLLRQTIADNTSLANMKTVRMLGEVLPSLWGESLKVQQELVAVGQSQLEIGQSQLGIGQSHLGIGQSHLEVGQRHLGIGQSHLGVGQEQLETSKQTFAATQRLLSEQKAQSDLIRERIRLQLAESRQRAEAIENDVKEMFRLEKDSPNYEWYKAMPGSRRHARVDETCNWFLGHADYRSWLEANSGILLVTANPGCGKSVLQKYLVDHDLPRKQRDSTVCYFFFQNNYQDRLKQALCALLLQMFWKDQRLIRYATRHYSATETFNQNEARITSVNVAWDIIQEVLKDKERAPLIFVIDALDECIEADQVRFIQFVNKLFSNPTFAPRFKIVITSRPYDEILYRLDPSEIVSTNGFHIRSEDVTKGIRDDIKTVITHHVKALGLSSDLAEYLKSRLSNVNNLTYLWVAFVFETRECRRLKRTRQGIDDWLKDVPWSIEEYYSKILRRIKSGNAEFVCTVFSFLLAGKRPLRVEEMNEVINVRSERDDLDLEPTEDFARTLEQQCGLFVIVHEGVVSFIHQTAREYLLPITGQEISYVPSTTWDHSFTMALAHFEVADRCLTYLNRDAMAQKTKSYRRQWAKTATQEKWNSRYFVTDGDASRRSSRLALDQRDIQMNSPVDPEPKIPEHRNCIPDLYVVERLRRTYKFLDYASNHWYAHILEAGDSQLQMDQRVLDLCGGDAAKLLTWRHALLDNMLLEYRSIPDTNEQLWYLTCLNFPRGVEFVYESGLGAEALNYVNGYKLTPLWMAASQGLHEIAKILLEKGADPSVSCRAYGIAWRPRRTTPLFTACERNHVAVVRSLLQAKTEVDIRKIPEERDLDTGWSKALGGYPIHIAIERSSYACLEALFKDATDAAGLLRLKDERGNTPLHVATGLSFLATMFLLEKGADLSIFNSAHHTPLGYAIRMRSADGEKDSVDVSDAIIELIINHGGSSVCQIPDGEIDRTPIHVICQRPHRVGGAARILRWMLAEGTSVDIADSQGRTPLHLACGPLNRHCHSSVEGEAAVMVQALLEAGADPNIVDSSGMTPLALAVINASLPVIKLLTKPQVRAPLKATLCDGKNLECASFFGRRQASGDSKEVLSLLLGKEVSRATLQVWKEKAEKEKAFWTRWVYYS